MSIFARSTFSPSANSPAHAAEEVEVLADAAVPVRAFLARLRERAAVGLDLLGREVIDVGETFLDELLRECVELVEVIGGIELAISPGKAEPLDVLLDGVDVLRVLLRRVRVVKAQVAKAAVRFGQAEIQADGFCMPHMKVPVRLRWEARMDALRVFPVLQVFLDRILYEIYHDDNNPFIEIFFLYQGGDAPAQPFRRTLAHPPARISPPHRT